MSKKATTKSCTLCCTGGHADSAGLGLSSTPYHTPPTFLNLPLLYLPILHSLPKDLHLYLKLELHSLLFPAGSHTPSLPVGLPAHVCLDGLKW